MMLDIKDNLKEYNDLLIRRIALSKMAPAEVVKLNMRELSFALLAEMRKVMAPKGSYREWNLARLKSANALPREARKGLGLKIKLGVYKAIGIKYNVAHGNVLEGGRITRRFVRKGRTGKERTVGMIRLGGRRIKLADGTKRTEKGKLLNYQQIAVMRELNRREQARGFMAHVVMVGARAMKIVPLMGRINFKLEQNVKRKTGPVAGLDWSSDQNGVRAVFQWGNFLSSMSAVAAKGFNKQKLESGVKRALASQGEILKREIAKRIQKALGTK